MPIVPGFMYGSVSNNLDPRSLGRVKVRVVGLWDGGESKWLTPSGWPGAGGLTYGSRYPVPLGAQVCVMFEHGDTEAGGMYLPSMYGATGRMSGHRVHGPQCVLNQDRYTGFGEGLPVNQQMQRACVWEDETFAHYITMHPTDKRVVIRHKKSKSYFMINGTDGVGKKSVSIVISGQTAVVVKSEGNISIEGQTVHIQGRRVNKSGGPL
jgi:hypothetical protein